MSRQPYTPPKRDFIGKAAPPGYIAGVGRGATGFTTRSDIGPARDSSSLAAAIASTSAAALAASSSDDGPNRKMIKRANNEDDEDEEAYLNENNYDEFAGYGGSLFNKDPYEDDDEEADRIYKEFDRHLDERGKATRDAKTNQDLDIFIKKRQGIQQQFSDLKANLKLVTEEEWANIPEVGDARNRKQRVARQDKFTPVPDSLLAHQAKIASGGDKLVYIEPKNQDISMDKSDSDDEEKRDIKPTNLPTTADGSLNISEMSEFRSNYMSMKLNRTIDDKETKSTENPRDYLTNLQSMISTQITDAATVNEYRKQFKLLRSANPTMQNAWIASVRLEEAAGKLKTARSLILEACEQCPKSVDLWLEAVRLHPKDVAKCLMVNALKENPRSVKLWIKSADLEVDDDAKRKIYSKARELVPKSELIWKRSVELEKPEEAKKLLREAVECCPDAVELWIALARLETYEEAEKVLIKASEKNPTARSIWIMAAKLYETADNKSLVEKVISYAIDKLKEHGIEIKRDEWFKEAVDADKAGFNLTSTEIIKRLIDWNIGDNSNKLSIMNEDINKFISKGSINCARAVHECIVSDTKFSKMEQVWLSWANFELVYGNKQTSSDIKNRVESVLRRAVKSENCMRSETLWLMLAEQHKNVNLEETKQILSDALDANSDSERIIIAAVELECENKNYDEARRILADACKSAKTPQLIKRSAQLEWSLGKFEDAVKTLKAGIEEFKVFPEFYLMLGQIEEQRNQNDIAKTYYSNGLKFNPTSVPLWISCANLEEKTVNFAKARATLARACERNKKVPLLWLERAKLEERAYKANKNKDKSMRNVTSELEKGIRECRGHPEISILDNELASIKKGNLLNLT